MNLIPSAGLVKQSLSSHSWLGLMVGALMYLVCLSGTLAVFYPELERWEQPQIREVQDYDPTALTPIPIGVNASMLASAAVLLLMGMKRAAPAVTSLREPDPAAAE